MQHVDVFPMANERSRGGLARATLTALWLAVIAVVWWWVSRAQLETAGLEDSMRAAGVTPSMFWLATSSVLGRGVELGFETLFYWAWWSAWGAPFRCGRFCVALASVSLIDAWATTLQALVREHAAALIPWLAPVLGFGLLRDPGASPGVPSHVAVFESLGLLTALRIVATAHFAARAANRRLAAPLAVTVSAWLLTRVAMWWGLDLARGMSPMP